MKRIFISLMLVAQIKANAQAVISQKDFSPLAGKWNGTLSYLDYTSKDRVQIPANTLIELSGSDSFDQYLYYTAEPNKNNKFRYAISADGKKLNEMTLMEKRSLEDGSWQLIFESRGTDGNDHRPADFRHIMLIGEKTFSIIKMVRFEGEEEYFQRHKYRFKR